MIRIKIHGNHTEIMDALEKADTYNTIFYSTMKRDGELVIYPANKKSERILKEYLEEFIGD